jgi:hypothetical protein
MPKQKMVDIKALSDIELITELVGRILGYEIYEFPDNEQTEILEDCRMLMHEYIHNYVVDKYGKYELFEDRFQEAFSAFLEYIND